MADETHGENPAEETERPEEEGRSRSKPFFIVGIGASAGGLDSLEKFFKNMMDRSGMAFVVIQHLSPDYKSLMVELLSKHTRMKIHRAENDMEVRPDNVYLIPPKKNLSIFKGKLYLMEQEQHGLNLPIDIFLKSLAEDQGESAVGIILSGTGSDGSRGLRSIKEKGGLVLVQDSGSAKFDGMPSSAVSTGLVDYVLPPDKMPQELLRYIEHPYSTRRADQGSAASKKEDYLNNIFLMLKEHTGIDFSMYKMNTVMRRVERRMGINQVEDLETYARFLKESPQEIDTLHRELLIGVTSFFRDPDAYKIIEHTIIPAILNEKGYGSPVRCWVMGCSTGEEAYSLAMLLRSYMENLNKHYDVKIFATDVDPRAIATAGEGSYTQSIVADVPAEMIAKYFTKMGNRFQVNKEIREMVIFAKHNALKDPPFNKIDLISCRNLLIYMTAEAQKKILTYFQFSLNPEGYLFLGSSETVGEFASYFQSLNHRWKIFKYVSDKKMSISDHIGVPPRMVGPIQVRPREESSAHKLRRKIIDTIKDTLIDRYIPPTIAITESNQPLIIFGDVNRYLKIPAGEVDFDVINLLRKDLSPTLGLALHKALKNNEELVYPNVKVKEKGEIAAINLKVIPLTEKATNQRTIVITFEPVEHRGDSEETAEVEGVSVQAEQRIEDLEHELQYTRENLQATIEELETTNEELQATNQELMSANEELQSTNEELQSVNEELITVNAEYQAKIQELVELNDDMDNLLASTDIGTIFLDKNLLIRKFTPAITKTVNLMDMDVGRPINHITHNIDDENLVTDVDGVLKSLIPVEKDVRSQDGRWYLLRIHPYRTKDNYIKGIVITFIDITEKKATEEALTESENMYRAFFRNLPHELAYHKIVLDEEGEPVDFVYIDINEKFEKLFGLDKEKLIGKRVGELHARLKPIRLDWLPDYAEVALTGESIEFEKYLDELEQWFKVTVFSPQRHYFVSYFEDITGIRQQEEAWQQEQKKLEDLVRERTAALSEANQDLKEQMEKRAQVEREFLRAQYTFKMGNWTWDVADGGLRWSEGVYRIFGLDPETFPATYEAFLERVHPEDRDRVRSDVAAALDGEREYNVVHRILLPDDGVRFVQEQAEVFRDDGGAPTLMVGSVRDITEFRQRETECDALLDSLKKGEAEAAPR